MANNITSGDILVTIDKLPGDWRTVTGRSADRSVTKRRMVAHGPEVPVGASRVTLADRTFTRQWDSERDPALYRQLNTTPWAFDGATITIQDLDPDGVPIPGAVETLQGCAPMSWSAPDADPDSDDPGDFEVTFSVGTVA